MRWSVKVERVAKGVYRTMFTVGVQSFELAYSDDVEDAKIHCKFIAKMFLKALANLGLKPKTKGKNPHVESRCQKEDQGREGKRKTFLKV